MDMTKLPTMKRARKAKPLHDCVCGCGQQTRSTWASGHDGRATGWAIRIERGLITLGEVPETERPGAELRLKQRGIKVQAVKVA